MYRIDNSPSLHSNKAYFLQSLNQNNTNNAIFVISIILSHINPDLSRTHLKEENVTYGDDIKSLKLYDNGTVALLPKMRMTIIFILTTFISQENMSAKEICFCYICQLLNILYTM